MTVVQVLPAMVSGGVERGTVELATHLVAKGHRSVVVSAGGPMVEQLDAAGAEHVTMPLGTKSPLTFSYVRPLRRLLRETGADVLHARSRMPAWVARVAWATMKRAGRPAFVTTMHGLHSVNAYSAVMTTGQRVIAVSDTVAEHIRQNYPRADPARIRVVPRGVDPAAFPCGYQPDDTWLNAWHEQFPALRDRKVITLTGRLTRLKNHHDLIELVNRLNQRGIASTALIVGGDDPKRAAYAREVREHAAKLPEGQVVFTGHRPDVREVYAASDVVVSLSSRPESFGRTVLEALSLGVPVVGYDHGGVGEVLGRVFPAGRVPVGDLDALTGRVAEALERPPTVPEHHPFTLERSLRGTMAVYAEVVA